MSRPVAFLVHGYLGVGKTTVSRRLAETHGAVRFSPDEWLTRLFGDDPPAATFWDHYDAVQGIVDEVFPEFIRSGRSVVLDFGFWRREFRDRVRSLAEEAGGECRLIVVACDDSVAWERIERRNADLRGSVFVARETYDSLRSRLELPGEDEPHEVVRTDRA